MTAATGTGEALDGGPRAVRGPGGFSGPLCAGGPYTPAGRMRRWAGCVGGTSPPADRPRVAESAQFSSSASSATPVIRCSGYVRTASAVWSYAVTKPPSTRTGAMTRWLAAPSAFT